MNQFHTHPQKKQNPAKKFIKSGQIEIARRRRRWDRAVKVTSSGGEIGAIVRRAARLTIGALRSGLSLSLSLRSGLSSSRSLCVVFCLFSLALCVFCVTSEMIWSENRSVKSFPGQRGKFQSTGSYFPENNIYHRCQTCGLGGKWFPENIFPQNKRTLQEEHMQKVTECVILSKRSYCVFVL